MRAIAYDAFGPAADVLKLEDMPTPTPGPYQIRARAGGRVIQRWRGHY